MTEHWWERFVASTRKPQRLGRVPLADPGLPTRDLRQVVYDMSTTVATTVVVYGPGDIDECFRTLRQLAPELSHSVALPPGLALIRGDTNLPWAAVTGASGSAILFFLHPRAELSWMGAAREGVLDHLPRPWRWTRCTRGDGWDPTAVHLVNHGRAIPAWDVPSLREELDPSGRLQLGDQLETDLIDSGWLRSADADMFFLPVPFEDYVQYVILTPGVRAVALAADISPPPGRPVPRYLPHADFGHYVYRDIDGPKLVSATTELTAPAVHVRAVALAQYANSVRVMAYR